MDILGRNNPWMVSCNLDQRRGRGERSPESSAETQINGEDQVYKIQTSTEAEQCLRFLSWNCLVPVGYFVLWHLDSFFEWWLHEVHPLKLWSRSHHILRIYPEDSLLSFRSSGGPMTLRRIRQFWVQAGWFPDTTHDTTLATLASMFERKWLPNDGCLTEAHERACILAFLLCKDATWLIATFSREQTMTCSFNQTMCSHCVWCNSLCHCVRTAFQDIDILFAACTEYILWKAFLCLRVLAVSQSQESAQ